MRFRLIQVSLYMELSTTREATSCVATQELHSILWNYNNQVEEDEMGGPCSTNGGEEERL
jgi:hypothetical protein